jgi:hypothetical protein
MPRGPFLQRLDLRAATATYDLPEQLSACSGGDATVDDLHDDVDDVGQGPLQGVGEVVAGVEGVGGHADQDDRGGGAVEGLGQAGQGLGAEVVGPGARGGPAGRTSRTRIDPGSPPAVASTRTTSEALATSTASSGTSWWRARTRAPASRGSAASRAAACQPSPSSPRSELP